MYRVRMTLDYYWTNIAPRILNSFRSTKIGRLVNIYFNKSKEETGNVMEKYVYFTLEKLETKRLTRFREKV